MHPTQIPLISLHLLKNTLKYQNMITASFVGISTGFYTLKRLYEQKNINNPQTRSSLKDIMNALDIKDVF